MDVRKRPELVTVQVAYGRPERQLILSVEVEPGTSAREAVRQSGILQAFPEIDADNAVLGVYGRLVDGDHSVRASDRIEIYRPLKVDPKEARRQRARLPE
ncbi:RnfH family protein [Aquisalimonas sp.]|uniref:RnfH family protein n=1 Tax=Aquisalimonas sp. TaxID=1872621 RepID=UPI0025C545A2|nr:RnfH family protein [Aquisalimonas sp.]